jgi:hypothetical protein
LNELQQQSTKVEIKSKRFDEDDDLDIDNMGF